MEGRRRDIVAGGLWLRMIALAKRLFRLDLEKPAAAGK
jgi:hypothetical protein